MSRGSSKKMKSLDALNFNLIKINPLTIRQEEAFLSLKHLVLQGSAGTGKTFISFYIAFRELEQNYKDNIIIIRSAVPTRDIGFLPGTEKEKYKVYETPYISIVNQLFGRGDAYENLTKKDIINFMTTSYIRGITLDDSIVIVDECQNMTFHELDSIITRIGNNCRLIFCGDFYQSDLKKVDLISFLRILRAMEAFDTIEFNTDDIVRGDLVKKYLLTKEAIGVLNQ